MLASDPTTITDGVSLIILDDRFQRASRPGLVENKEPSISSRAITNGLRQRAKADDGAGYLFLPTPPVAVEIADPRTISAPYDDVPQNSEWLGVTGQLADIELDQLERIAPSCEY